MFRDNALMRALFFGPPSVYHGLAAVLVWATGAYFFCILATVPLFFLMGLAQFVGGLVAVKLEGRALSLGHLGAAAKQRYWLISLLFANQLGYTYAFRTAPAAQVDLIYYLWPTLLICTETMRLRRGLTGRQILGLLLGFGGVSYLVLPNVSAESGAAYLPGYLGSISAACCWTAYSLLVRIYDERGTDSSGSGTAEDVLITGFLCLLISFVIREPLHLSSSELGLTLLLGISVFGGAFTFWRKGLAAGHPTLVGGMANFIPVLSVAVLVASGIAPMTSRLAYAAALVTAGCFCLGGRPLTSRAQPAH